MDQTSMNVSPEEFAGDEPIEIPFSALSDHDRQEVLRLAADNSGIFDDDDLTID